MIQRDMQAFMVLFAMVIASAFTMPCPHPCKCFTVDNQTQVANCTDFPVNNMTITWDVLNISLARHHASPVFVMEKKSLENFTQLTHLLITGAGSIPFVNISSFDKLLRLNTLSLIKNGIKKINPNTFAKHWNLQYLSLRNNPELFVASSFIMSKSIIELDLSECSLNTLKTEYFEGLPRLEILRVKGNNLTILGSKFVPSSLKVLDLTNNRIENAYGVYDDFETYKHLTKIDLTGNPINCTCKLWEFGIKLSNEGVAFKHSITCKNTGKSLDYMQWCVGK